MYKVITHNNSKEYFEELEINDNELFVCPHTNFSFMIRERAKICKDFWRVIDIEALLNSIYKKWNSKTNQIILKATVRNIILELMENANEETLKELKFFDDNINTLFSDLKIIAESGIKKIQFKDKTLTKLTIQSIYDKLLLDREYQRISKELFSTSNLKMFYKKLKGYNFGEVKKICFYNMNNLDLNRWIIIELLNMIGFEIEFRIPYFQGLTVSNKCWDELYGDKNIFEWKMASESVKDLNVFKYINFLEGTHNSGVVDEGVTTKTYKQISDFKELINDKAVLTLYRDSIKSCKDIERELNSIESCFETTLGRFFKNLYKCKVKDNVVQLDFLTYRELIASGWMETQGWNGLRLFEYLNDNAEYFKDIKTIDEIIFRIEKLKELEAVNYTFEEQFKEKIKEDEQKRLLLNPFRIFNYNNLEKYNITATYMLTLTIRLKNFILKALRNNSDFININDHFEILKIAFRNKYILEKNKNGTKDERKCIARIWSILKSEEKFLEEMHKDELLEHLGIYFTFKNDDSPEEEKDFAIDQLEGVMYRNHMLNMEDKKIIITDLSYKAYEKYINSKSMNEKIITEHDLYEIIDNSLGGKQKEYVQKAFSLKVKSEKIVGYYLKFLLANFFINFDGKKELSWIEGLRDKDSKSIILKQIESIYLNSQIAANGLDEEITKFDEESLEDIYSYEIEELKEHNTKYSEVNYRDLDFCSRKFLYASVIDKHIKYESDFQSKLAFSGILSILKDSMKNSNKDIIEFIFPLFPQWKEVMKENILTCEYGRKPIRDYKYFDGINYPKNIDTLYLLKSKYVIGEKWKVKNRYKNGNFTSEEFYKGFLKEYLSAQEFNGGGHCMMCPYLKICKKGVFAIDNK